MWRSLSSDATLIVVVNTTSQIRNQSLLQGILCKSFIGSCYRVAESSASGVKRNNRNRGKRGWNNRCRAPQAPSSRFSPPWLDVVVPVTPELFATSRVDSSAFATNRHVKVDVLTQDIISGDMGKRKVIAMESKELTR